MFSIFWCIALSGFVKDRQLDISVAAKWGKTNWLSEVTCFFNEFAAEKYDQFVDTLNRMNKFPKIEFFSFLDELKPILTNEEINLLLYLLNYNYYSPRISFYTSIQNKKYIPKLDFEPNYTQVIYYNFELNKTNIIFSKNVTIRPISQVDSAQKQILRGYGVELRPFKYSMEYGVKNLDKQIHSSNNMSVDTTMQFIEEYFNTTKLKEGSMEKIREKLLSFVSRDSEEAPFSTLANIAQNWPITLYIISKENPKFFEDEDEFICDVQPGKNVAYLNGRSIPVSAIDPYSMVDIIKEEKTYKEILRSDFNLTDTAADYVTNIEVKKTPLVVDIRGAPIIYVNDLETDGRYRKWHKSLKTLFGALKAPPKIRSNIVNIILTVDPETDFKLIAKAGEMMKSGYAARFGFIFSPNSNENMVNAFAHAATLEKGFQFVTELSNEAGNDPETAFKTAFEKVTKGKWLKFNEESKEYTNECLNYKSHLKSPSIWVNGVLYTSAEDLIDYMEIAPMEAVDAARNLLINCVDMPDDILGYILMKKNAIKHAVPEIHNDKMIPLMLSTASVEKQRRFVEFIKNIKYDYEDSEAPQVTIWTTSNAGIIGKLKKQISIPIRIKTFDNEFPEEIRDLFLFGEYNENSIIVNGRVLNINLETDEDVEELIKWQSFHYVNQLSQQMTFESIIFNGSKPSQRVMDDLILYWSTIILSLEWREIKRINLHQDNFDPELKSVFTSDGDEDVTLSVVIDPFSKEFQRVIGILKSIANFELCKIQLRLNPPENVTKVPTSFYRYADDTDSCLFSIFNESITYSVILDTPETWLVEQSRADLDLDNVLSRELEKGKFYGEYLLTDLILEGSAVDERGKNADGIQIKLEEYPSDTTVMRNLGYWQLKALPGLYHIKLANKWSSDSFVIANTTKTQIVASYSWSQRPIAIHQIKMPGKRVDDSVDDGKIHVFAVASGSLYERLLKIMMLSVIKNSYNSTCKFWLMRNYLSPHLVSQLDFMSQKYGFEYELITYHWPYWLRRQTEKQRIIWGNKILFLDVIFPLSLKRVIYIDSDQVVRTNMRELMTMELGKAPYAFTPMCNSRTETEPFRFWNRGYWKEHLRGRPYHISALFAIDLKQFRETAAGDWLRYYYQALSRDPASLANLDQDLPNFAQDRIPIYSLPQEWLWCETWCSDETMNNARTIDLCNNPLTHSGKLDIAKTRISEWPGLDKEAAKIEIEAEIQLKEEENLIKNDEL